MQLWAGLQERTVGQPSYVRGFRFLAAFFSSTSMTVSLAAIPVKLAKESSKGSMPEESNLQTGLHLSQFILQKSFDFSFRVSARSHVRAYNLHKKHEERNTPFDKTIVEATAIKSEGHIVPDIIIKINTRIPNLEGLHEINQSFLPPHPRLYLITHPLDRIGLTAIPADLDRVAAIIESLECTGDLPSVFRSRQVGFRYSDLYKVQS
ncbi:hypothetical protein GYMLUDRAFT_923477 [Collybiopsis luxurians FD-317 M1]|uniref:Uncharacterized protein n=1 Tax=Collybiopsis luxurians FD-317 M1 TaxID=944289 RepID=A0A0D0ATL5_9AGAR|nr:hypothetical protein GYMLUDRAFT_923477 [Collybiopsis luxurians FD-317 M1]